MSVIKDNADEVMAEALWHIDAEAELHGWDADAGLYAVMLHPIEHEGVKAGVIELMPVPAWNLVLDSSDSTRGALQSMAYMMSIAPTEMKEMTFPQDDLYGLAFITEAWVLKANRGADGEPDPEVVASIEATMQAGSIAEHPDRVEIRFVYCVSRTGIASALSHERDGIAEALQGGEGIMSGAIPEALKEILKGITS